MTETLNIYKVTEQILMYVTSDTITKNMPKLWRHNIYHMLVEAVLKMQSHVYHASSDPEERAMYLKRYLTELEHVKSLSRVAHERRVLTHGQADYLDRLYESAGKQAAAWKKKSSNK